MHYRHEIEHAPANFAFVGLQVPTARIVPLTDPYCISRLRILFFQLITFCFSPIQFDVEDRHLPNRQIIPESSLLWGFYIVMV